MVKEFNNMTEVNHWKVVPIKEVPTGTRILDTIWKMKKKNDILSVRVMIWKSIQNIHEVVK